MTEAQRGSHLLNRLICILLYGASYSMRRYPTTNGEGYGVALGQNDLLKNLEPFRP
jgi:hypothetical protein